MSDKIDWQAYLDGSLSASQCIEARRMLRKDPACRRELKALKSLIGQVAHAGRSEKVPSGRYDHLFAAKRPIPLAHRVALALLPVAIAALLWQSGLLSPRFERTSPKVSVTGDPTVAAKWASSQLGVALPRVAMAGKATLCTARCGDGWASFSYHVGKDRYHLFMTRRATRDFLDRNRLVGNSVQWQQKGVSFYLAGPSPQIRMTLADAARREIEPQSTMPPALSHCGTP